MELGGVAGDVFEVELGFSIDKPGLTAVRPENRQFQSNCVEMAGRGIHLAWGACGQSWHPDAEKESTVELGFRLLWWPVEKTGRPVHFSAERVTLASNTEYLTKNTEF